MRRVVDEKSKISIDFVTKLFNMEPASVDRKLKDGREERNDRRNERKQKAQEFVGWIKGGERKVTIWN